MESDSKTSSEDESMDITRPDGSGGAPKFYECVFCKRGFTTAQALGGHMNIHRKDRIKSGRIINNTSSRSAADDDDDDELINFNFLSPPPTYSMFGDLVNSTDDYRFFPAVGRWGLVSPPDIVEGTRTCLNLIGGEDWPAALSLKIGPPIIGDDDDDEKKLREDGDLDLELRLGHRP